MTMATKCVILIIIIAKSLLCNDMKGATTRHVKFHINVEPQERDITNFISSVFRYYIKDSEIVTMVTRKDENLDSIFSKITHNIKRLTVQNTDNIEQFKELNIPSQFYRSDVIIILIHNLQLLVKVISIGEKSFYWNYQGRFLIVVTSCYNRRTAILQDTFDVLWSARLLQTLVFYEQCNKKHEFANRLRVAIYNPFFNKIIAASFKGTLNKTASLIDSMFGSLKDMNGYPITVTAGTDFMPMLKIVRNADGNYTYKGVFGNVFTSIIRLLNFTPIHVNEKLTAPDSGSRLPNGTWTNLMGDLAERRAELALRSVLISHARYQDFPFVKLFVFSKLGIVVHKSKPIPKWMSIILPFEVETWILILITFFLFGFYVVTLKHVNSCGESPIKTFLDLLSLLLDISVEEPKKIYESYYFVLWLFFSIVISSLYKESILSFLTVPRYFPQISTFKDLVQFGITLLGKTAILRILGQSSNPYLKVLHTKAQMEPNITKAQMKVGQHESFAAISVKEQLQYIKKRLPSCGDDDNYYILEENVGQYMSSFCVRRDFPYLKRFDSIVTRIIESGFVEQWVEEVMNEAEMEHRKNRCTSFSKLFPLTIHDVYSCFAVLLLGCLISIIQFGFEMCILRYRQR